jgi:hypothetical protein
MIDVERSKEPPKSLALKAKWDGEDVIRTLRRDFHEKCYLCEKKVALREVEVEHRIPRSVSQEGKFDWRNLFPACQFCNKRRSGCAYPSEGLISPGDDVEGRIDQRMYTSENGLSAVCEFRPKRLGDVPAMRTAEELNHIHSAETATTPRATMGMLDFLDEIHDHYHGTLWPLEIKVLRGRQRGEPDADAEAKLAGLLSRRAPFTMLMRSVVHPALVDLFD